MRGAVQMQITTIGLDIAKNVFQVHGIDANETVVVRKRLRRSQVLAFFKALPPCLIAREAQADKLFKESLEIADKATPENVSVARLTPVSGPLLGSRRRSTAIAWRLMAKSGGQTLP